MIKTRMWIGLLLAFYLLVGRWNLNRIGVDMERAYHLQPRLWAVIALAVLVLLDQSISRWRKSRRTANNPRVGALALATVVFFAYMIITALWAPDPEMAERQAFALLLNALIAVILFLALRNEKPQAVRVEFWKGFALLAGVIALASFAGTQSQRFQSLGGGPNTFGRNMGLLVLSGIYFAQTNRTAILRPVWWLTAITGVLLVLLSGSRGAILSLAVSATVFQVIDRQPLSKKMVLFIVAAIAGTLAITQTRLGTQAQEVFAQRVLDLTIEQQHTSGRAWIYRESFRIGMEEPLFGAGLYAGVATIGFYPHNIFLEAFAEGGAIGLLLLIAVMVLGAARLVKVRRRVNAATVAALAHVLVGAQFSGNLFDSRGVFMFLMLAAVPMAVPGSKGTGKRSKGRLLPHSRSLAPPRPRCQGSGSKGPVNGYSNHAGQSARVSSA